MAELAKTDQTDDDELLRIIAQAVRSLQFGQVQITVHASRVVRVEKTERIRIEASDPRNGGDDI